MVTSAIKARFELGLLISLVLFGACSAPALGHFAITYYDNYNYATGAWDAWQAVPTPLDAWDAKYLADDTLGKTVFTDHKMDSIPVFDLRGGLFSKDGHASGGEDWNPLESIGDGVSGQSAHHVFAALFKGLIYLEAGDVFSVASDDDVYVFLDGDTAWGQEVLSIPFVSFFGTDSTVVTAAQAGLHTMTVKYIERRNIHSGIEMTLDGEHLQNAEASVDIKPGSCPNPFNSKSKGNVPVALVGNTIVDPGTVFLVVLDRPGADPVPALSEFEIKDSTQPHDGDPANCYDCFDAEANLNCDLWDATVTPPVPGTDGVLDSYCGDGIPDLIVKFDTQVLAAAIGERERDECVELELIGETYDGFPISARDSVLWRK